MNYIDITNLLRTTANSVNENGFFLNAAGKNSEQRKSALSICGAETYPQIAVFHLKAKPNFLNDAENYDILVGFFEPDHISSAASQDDDYSNGVLKPTETIIGEMYDLAMLYLSTLSDTLNIVDVELGIEIKQFSETLSGVSAIFKVQSKQSC